MDRAYEPLSVGVGGRRRLFVIRIDSRGEDMHASVLLPPIFTRIAADAELLADELL